MIRHWLRTAGLVLVLPAVLVKADAAGAKANSVQPSAKTPAVQPAIQPAAQPVIQPLVESRRLVDRPDERVSVLENGLTVILKTHRTAPVACVQMYCKTGSIYEQEYLGAGMSHLFEHLLHGGATRDRTEEESRRILDEIGGNANAYTSYDVTCYYINTAREHAATAVSLLGNWITAPIFPEEAFDREWGVVQRELERDVDDPDRQVFYLMMETMYPGHPARFPIIGHQPVVQTLKKEDIVGYYHRMYVPDNIVVAIVGDIDLDQMLGTVSKKFAGFKRKRVPTIVMPEQQPMVTPRSATKHMKVQAAALRLAWPTIPLTHPDLYALDVLSFILSEGESARLQRSIRDAGLTYTIASSSFTPIWANGMFVISARLAPDKIDAAKDAVLQQIAHIQQELVPGEELEKAKKQKVSEHVFQMQTAQSIASMIANDYIATGDMHFSSAYVDNIQKVTAEEVRQVARKYLLPERLATVSLMPETVAATQPAEVAEADKPRPVREIKLDNGLRCVIRQDPTTPLVAVHAYALGGLTFEDEKTNGLSRLASLLVMRGTETRSAQDIAHFFDSRGGNFNTSSGYNSLLFQAEVLKEDFADTLQVVADVILKPVFPDEDLMLYRSRQLDAIERIGETWRTELFSYARRRFFKDSPYRFDDVGSADVIANATRGQVADFYHRLVTPEDMVVAIFGDVDPELAESLIRRHFTNMGKGKAALPEVPAQQPEQPELFILKKSPERKAAGVAVGFAGMTVHDKDDRAKMAVLDTIMSGYRYPTGWLEESLRGGTTSLVYEVHAVNQPGLLPGMFLIYAACQPEKVNEVYGIITQQIDKARAGKISPEELERAKTIIVTTELMENQTNASRAMQTGINVLYGLGNDYDEQFLEAVKSVTLEDVKNIAQKYLTVPRVAVVTPAPEQVSIGIKPVVETQR